MAIKYSDEFRRDAMRIAITSGQARPAIASDLGVSVSTLSKWVQRHPLPSFATFASITFLTAALRGAR